MGTRVSLPDSPRLLESSEETPYKASPEVVLAEVSSHEGPVLVDFDETLYLRNSTEDFIDLARPALLAVIALRLLELVRPWRWTGGDVTRDNWRVGLIYHLFPWTRWRWRKQVGELARAFGNQPLLKALRTRAEAATIVTIGFVPIVTPLAMALDLPGARIVGARLNAFSDRRLGKLELALRALGRDIVGASLVVTDSMTDLPLLQACARPLFAVWPEAQYRRGLSGTYFPGQYISQVKRPGEHYFRRAVLQEDYALWVLSSIALTVTPIRHVAGLLLLLVSFWTIYERGYVDNDLMGLKLEKDPKLTAAFHLRPVATPFWPPWIWSAVAGLIGCWVLRGSQYPPWGDCVVWEAVLVGTYLWFCWYNRSEKRRRVWMFAILQLARTAAFVPLVLVTPIGAMALGAHVLSRWTPYYLYRLGGRDWPQAANVGLIRVLFFLVSSLMLAIAEGWRSAITWTTLAILVWATYRARVEWRSPSDGAAESSAAR